MIAHPPLQAVIMAGGRGTRFWPWSRRQRPKQFLPITGPDTMLRQTVSRLLPSLSEQDIFIVSTEDLASEIREQLPGLPPENLILEPEGRNTAPCLILALLHLERLRGTGVMAVLAADHFIGDPDLFEMDLQLAANHARQKGGLVTFGIRPNYPETGFGYIEALGEGEVLPVKAFREKPPLEIALEYLHSGHHYWNSGMFVWTLADFRAELSRHCPDMLAMMDGWSRDGAQPKDLPAIYAQLPALSIDYALMERSRNVALVPARFRWSDVGSWPAAIQFRSADSRGNVTSGETILLETDRCAFFGKDRLIAAAGLQDLIVVDDRDALLICHKDWSQSVKDVVEELKRRQKEHLL